MEFPVYSPCVLKMCVSSVFGASFFLKECFSTPGDGVKSLYYPGVFDGAVRVQEYYGKRARFQHAADEGIGQKTTCLLSGHNNPMVTS